MAYYPIILIKHFSLGIRTTWKWGMSEHIKSVQFNSKRTITCGYKQYSLGFLSITIVYG